MRKHSSQGICMVVFGRTRLERYQLVFHEPPLYAHADFLLVFTITPQSLEDHFSFFKRSATLVLEKQRQKFFWFKDHH